MERINPRHRDDMRVLVAVFAAAILTVAAGRGCSTKTLQLGERQTAFMETGRAISLRQNVLPLSIRKCSMIGPSASAGKYVNSPTMTITPTSRPTKSGP